jgi:uncharacterized protein
MKRFLLLLLAGLPLLSNAADKLEVFELVSLKLGAHSINVQLADTPEKRAQGLMFQQSADPGMLLVYSEPTPISLWMANTAMALDVAYIGPDWTIVQLVQLQPYDKTPVPSPGAVIAALEMPRGWFASHGVVVTDKVTLQR